MSALPRRGDPLRALARPSGLAALAVTAIAALLSVQAADGPWLTELGRAIANRGGIPDGVPYASAPTAGWHNVPVLGELVFALLGTVGSRGLQIAQVAAVAGTLALLARDARRAGAQGARAGHRAAAAPARLLRPDRRHPRPALLPAAVRRLRAAAAVGVAGALESHLADRPAVRPVGEPARRRAHGSRGRGRVPDLRARTPAARREHRGDGRLRARPVRQSRALAHAVVRARRAAQRGRAPGHRPVGAAQPAQLARCRVRACRGGAAGGRPARAPARCGSSWRSAGSRC